ncbi:hypothetical protein HS048_35160 [Planomonospora sp. ID91781]|uniref:hypothetical protein n=1 Tax=Planomonospora sp. ID91781 TaxID=2738135 RepID=UPI0018C3EBF8|nr:hypothetical protein [Planomonospora sp. ID91781]MBG0825915.1 hypothetical protein [Planomonospora sp. ID91781]
MSDETTVLEQASRAAHARMERYPAAIPAIDIASAAGNAPEHRHGGRAGATRSAAGRSVPAPGTSPPRDHPARSCAIAVPATEPPMPTAGSPDALPRPGPPEHPRGPSSAASTPLE